MRDRLRTSTPPSDPSQAELAVDDTSRVGELLDGRYELIRKIGEGGMGQVYEARHRVLGRRFAVKLLHPELVRSSRMLRRFSRESLSASRIESEHVVAVVDCGHLADGAPYFAMEYLRGESLRQVLRQDGQLLAERAVRLVSQVCRGLRAAHELGLIHRDLKPENIFIERTDDGRERAKILDFGVVQTNGGNSTARAGALIGTLRYMAPEQARGDARLDERADLYAVGAVLYECLAGVAAHPGRNAEEVLFHIMGQDPASLGELRPDLNPGLVAVVHRCIAREPDERFASINQLLMALTPYARERPARLLSSAEPTRLPSTEQTRNELSWSTTPPKARGLAPAIKWFTGGIVWIATASLCGYVLHLPDRNAPPRAQPAPKSPTLAQPSVASEVSAAARPIAMNAVGSASASPSVSSSGSVVKPPRQQRPAPGSTRPPSSASSDDYRSRLDRNDPYADEPRER